MAELEQIKRSKPSIARLKKAAALARKNSKNWANLATTGKDGGK